LFLLNELNLIQVVEANERKVSKVIFRPISIDLAKAANATKKMKRLFSTKVIKRKKQTQGDNADSNNSSLKPESDDGVVSISREQLLLVPPEGPASVIKDKTGQ
jgi:hypothetical protein